MRCVCYMSLLLACCNAASALAAPEGKTIDFPCSRNLSDGRVLVDGTQWDERMRQLGYILDDGAYVPFEVLRFTQTAVHDEIWADGLCLLKLLPVTR